MKLKGKERMPFDKGQIREWALKQLTIRGCEVWRQANLATPGRKFIGRYGIADISGITKVGVRVECEVKTKGDTIKPDQYEFMAMIKKMGGITLLATEENGKLVIKEFPI